MSKQSEGTESTFRPARPGAGMILALILLVLCPMVFYGAMVFRDWEPKAPDTSAAQPFGLWGSEIERETGQVPLWYPYIFSGMPSYGSLIYTPRSPINPVAMVQSLVHGAARNLLRLLAVAGLAGFALLRRWGFSVLSSCTGALLYSLTPYIPGSIAAGHSTKLEALCLVPLFLLAIDLFLHRPDLLRSAILAAAGALLAWASHPQVAFYGLLIGVLYAAGVLLIERRRPSSASAWARMLGLLVLAVLLSAALVAEPYLAVHDYAPYSIRGGGSDGAAGEGGGGVGWEYATAWSFHPEELISFLFPAWFGLQGETYWGKMPFTSSTHYFGILALALAVFALVRRRDRMRWIWAGISGVVLLIGFGRRSHRLRADVQAGPILQQVPGSFHDLQSPSLHPGPSGRGGPRLPSDLTSAWGREAKEPKKRDKRARPGDPE